MIYYQHLFSLDTFGERHFHVCRSHFFLFFCFSHFSCVPFTEDSLIKFSVRLEERTKLKDSTTHKWVTFLCFYLKRRGWIEYEYANEFWKKNTILIYMYRQTLIRSLNLCPNAKWAKKKLSKIALKIVKDKKFDFVHKKWRARGFIAFNQPKSEQVDFEQRDIPVNCFAKCRS